MKHPILFIHGANASHVSFNFITSRLEDDYDIEALFFEYDINDLSLDQVRVKLDECLSKFDTKVHIVGHSLGGVLAASIAQTHPKVVSAITIAAPLAGVDSPMTDFFKPFNRFLRNIDMHQSAFVLARQAPVAPVFTIQTTGGYNAFLPGPSDGVVTLSSQLLPTATQSMIVSLNHFEVLLDFSVSEAIAIFIGQVEEELK